MLLVEYRLLDKLKVINEGTGPNKKLRVRGKFQKCDEQNNNGRIYPKKILESQVTSLQEKIADRALVGALDHPPNDAIHLSQASHLITKLWVENNGDVMGEAEILSTPSGKIVEALLNDGVKIGISSRGLGTISEGKNGKVVNEDFKLITFDLVSDPSTKGAFPELTESQKLNSEKAQRIVSDMKKQRILLTALSAKIDEKLEESKKNRCWKGYKPTPGKKAYSDGSCQKSESKEDLDEGLVKKANKEKKKDWEIGGETNQIVAGMRRGRSRLNRKLSPGPESVSRVAKVVRGQVKKNNISKDAYRGHLKSEKKPNLPESFKFAENTSIKSMVGMLIEGMVKKLNKAKKKDWEVNSGEKSKAAGFSTSPKPLTNDDMAKIKSRRDRGDLTKTPTQVAQSAQGDRAKKARALKFSKKKKLPTLESIKLILQRVEEGTATSEDIKLVKEALSSIVNR